MKSKFYYSYYFNLVNLC